MNVHRLAASALVRAPAKLNLFFEILARRGDGFHEVETLMAPISLYDTLVASPGPPGTIRLTCRWSHPGDVIRDIVLNVRLKLRNPGKISFAERSHEVVRWCCGLRKARSASCQDHYPVHEQVPGKLRQLIQKTVHR